MKNSLQDLNELIPEYINNKLTGQKLNAFEEALKGDPGLEEAVSNARDIRFVLEEKEAFKDLELIQSLHKSFDEYNGHRQSSKSNRISSRLGLLLILLLMCCSVVFLTYASRQSNAPPLLNAPYPVDQFVLPNQNTLMTSIEKYKRQNYQESLPGLLASKDQTSITEIKFVLMTNYYYLGQYEKALAILSEDRSTEPDLLSEQFEFYRTHTLVRTHMRIIKAIISPIKSAHRTRV